MTKLKQIPYDENSILLEISDLKLLLGELLEAQKEYPGAAMILRPNQPAVIAVTNVNLLLERTKGN